MKIVKRDGRIVEFKKDKVINAVSKAMLDVNETIDFEVANGIANTIERLIRVTKSDDVEINVEDIQDTVEVELMQEYPEVAKAYILYRNERTKLRQQGWNMTQLQKDIYNSKYRNDGESFDEFISRVSGGNLEVAKLIRNQDFLFAGRILAGRGVDRNVSLSNCYVLPPPEDNLESIFDTAKQMARTYSYGGGVGIDLSKLRPKGSPVNNAALTTSGAVSFMELYDTTTSVIGQRGRRGALMLSMSVDHPDINDFITSKADTDKINHANISVRGTKNFFKQNTLEKQETLDLIAENNWNVGEPGLLYWDRIEQWHLLSEHPDYKLTGVNPCAEETLPDFGNCLLGSINLSNFVINPFTDKARIDTDRLKDAVRTSVVGLNEVLEEGISKHPLEQQRATAHDFRQIGLGIMGLADLFIKLGVEYGSMESLEISERLGMLFLYTAIDESIELAKEHGTYPKYDYDYISKSDMFKCLPPYLQDKIKKYGMRNSHVLSVAPTGSISSLIGVSGGIEPHFSISYTRTTKSLSNDGDVDYKVYTKVFEDLMDSKNIKHESDLPSYCITSHDIKPLNRIKLQSVWQSYIDSAISSTINLKEDTTVDEVKQIYKWGYKYKLKGITVFRDGCLRLGILNTDEDEDEDCDT